MKIAEYFEAVKDLLLVIPFVVDFKILKQVDRSRNGHLRVRVTLSNNSQLEFSEFVEQDASDEIEIVTYSYHWADENERLIRRWDNAPHFPNLKNFPHHIHIEEDEVISGDPINIFAVLDEIGKSLKQ